MKKGVTRDEHERYELQEAGPTHFEFETRSETARRRKKIERTKRRKVWLNSDKEREKE